MLRFYGVAVLFWRTITEHAPRCGVHQWRRQLGEKKKLTRVCCSHMHLLFDELCDGDGFLISVKRCTMRSKSTNEWRCPCSLRCALSNASGAERCRTYFRASEAMRIVRTLGKGFFVVRRTTRRCFDADLRGPWATPLLKFLTVLFLPYTWLPQVLLLTTRRLICEALVI